MLHLGKEHTMSESGILSKSQILNQLDRLTISADAKAIIFDISEVCATVGDQIFVIGRYVVSFILDLVRQFPNTAFGAVVGFVVSSLIASIPLGAFDTVPAVRGPPA